MRILLALLAATTLWAPPARGAGTVSGPAAPVRPAAVAVFTPVPAAWGTAMAGFSKTLFQRELSIDVPMDRALVAPIVAQLELKYPGLTAAQFGRLSKAERETRAAEAVEAAKAQLKAETAALAAQAAELAAQAQSDPAKAPELAEALAALKRVLFYQDYTDPAEESAAAEAGRAVRRAIGLLTEARVGQILGEESLSLPGNELVGSVPTAEDRANIPVSEGTPHASLLLLADELSALAKPASADADALAKRLAALEKTALISLAETGESIQHFAAVQIYKELAQARRTKSYAASVNKILEQVAKDSPYGNVKALAARGLLGSHDLGDGVERAASIAAESGSKGFMQQVKVQVEARAAEAQTQRDKDKIAAAAASLDQAIASAAEAQAPPAPPADPAPADPADSSAQPADPADSTAQPAPDRSRGVRGFIGRNRVFVGLLLVLAAVALFRFWPSPAPVEPVQPPVEVTQPVPPVDRPTTAPQARDPLRPNSPAENAAMQRHIQDILDGRAGEPRDD